MAECLSGFAANLRVLFFSEGRPKEPFLFGPRFGFESSVKL